jgi:predicted phosphodiesterase
MRLRTQESLIAALALALAACGVGSTAPALEMGPAINSAGLQAQQLALPKRPDSVRMGVIGDSGTGDANQYRVAEQLAGFHKLFPYEFVVMLGDNTYGGESARDWELRFERPYKPLLDAGVKFYAALGNHDTPNQRMYKPFNMNGERFYTFKPKAGVRLFAIDSNYLSPEQMQWLEKELAASGSEWKICFFHHPLYSSGGRHGSDTALRDQLEPLFVKYGVDVVLTGHDHFYERIKPQKGIHHFVVGGSAKLRRGDIEKTDLTAKGFDQGYSFMAVEITGNEFHYQAISDLGKTIDSGVITRQAKAATVTK